MEYLHVDNTISRNYHSLRALDYVVICGFLLLSVLIGVVVAFLSRKQEGTESYLLGGRMMHAVPVALSFSASNISAIAVIGNPVEFYRYGTMYSWLAISYAVGSLASVFIIIPLLYRLRITSIYEYYELRFNRTLRLINTTAFILSQSLYTAIIIYAPGIALSTVAGLDLWLSITTIGVICTIYTTIGGLKAVIYTDVFQMVVILLGFLFIVIRGMSAAGGFGEALKIAEANGRIDFIHFEMDPSIRHTFWSFAIGGGFLFTGTFGINQTFVQRYLSCKSERHAKWSLWINLIVLYIFLALTCITGILMYAYYANCDPYTAGWVDKFDQLLPYYAMELLHDSPGLPGLFVCCVFSGTLSTVSSTINAMATITYKDFFTGGNCLLNFSSVVIAKILVVLYGIFCIVLTVIVGQLGGVLQAAISIIGIIQGPSLGIFLAGCLIPSINCIGAVFGFVVGLAMTSWIYIGNFLYPPPQKFSSLLPVSVENCLFNTSTTTWNHTVAFQQNPSYNMSTNYSEKTNNENYGDNSLDIYAMSYLYYACFGSTITIVSGFIASLLTLPEPSFNPPGLTIYHNTTGKIDPPRTPEGTLVPICKRMKSIFCNHKILQDKDTTEDSTRIKTIRVETPGDRHGMDSLMPTPKEEEEEAI